MRTSGSGLCLTAMLLSFRAVVGPGTMVALKTKGLFVRYFGVSNLYDARRFNGGGCSREQNVSRRLPFILQLANQAGFM